MEGHVLVGKISDDESIVATNATFADGGRNGTLSVGISASEECTTNDYSQASLFQFKVPVAIVINALGKIEGGGEGGWFQQRIREIQGNSTLPVSLAELINGDATEHNLAVYLLSSDEELLACGFLKKLDEDTAAEYDALLNGLSQGEEPVKDNSSSGSKIGLFVSAAIAAVGIAIVLGDVLAL